MRNKHEIDIRPDEDVLIPREAIIKTNIGEFLIKEWTFATYKPIRDNVEGFFEKLAKKGLDASLIFHRPAAYTYWDKIGRFLFGDDGIDKLPEYTDEEIKEVDDKLLHEEEQLRDISFIAADYAVPVLSHVADVDEEKLEELAIDELLAFFFTVLDLNRGYLKNSLGRFGKLYLTPLTPEESKQASEESPKSGKEANS